MGKPNRKVELRRRRRTRIRKGIAGTPKKPRLAVFRSARHIYAQVVDDRAGTTVTEASSRCSDLPELPEDVELSTKRALAWRVGMLAAQRCKEAGVERIVFDRGGFLYHGRVKALADGARHGGLEF